MSEISIKENPKSELVFTKSAKVTPEYEAAVTKFADEHKNQKFLNDSHNHASLLAGLMIGRADEHDEVLIYSKSLPSYCFGDALKNCKSRNVRILLDDSSGADDLNNLSEEDKKRITFRILKVADGEHFWISGDSFRLEIDHDKARAVANFNDPEAIKILQSRFEKLWSSVE